MAIEAYRCSSLTWQSLAIIVLVSAGGSFSVLVMILKGIGNHMS
jgi:hypothetical protein